MLLREASLMRSLHHPNVLRLHSAFLVEDSAWLVLPLVAGGCVSTALERRARRMSGSHASPSAPSSSSPRPHALTTSSDGSGSGSGHSGSHHHHHQHLAPPLPPPLGGVRGDEALLATIARGALRGLAYLHAAGTAHRDLKAANLLLGARGEVIVADFGVAATLERATAAPQCCPAPEVAAATAASATERSSSSYNSGGWLSSPPSPSPCSSSQQAQDSDSSSHQHLGYLSRTTCVGTACYMAPEVIAGLEEGYDAAAADIWSFGVTLLELAAGSPPHAGAQSLVAVALAVAHGEAPTLHAHCAALGAPLPSAAARDFAAACLSREPSGRPSAAALLQHRFLRLARDDAYVASRLLPGGCMASGIGGGGCSKVPPSPAAAAAGAATTAPSASSAFAAAAASASASASAGQQEQHRESNGGGQHNKKTKEVHSLTWQVPPYAALATLVSGGSGTIARGGSGSGSDSTSSSYAAAAAPPVSLSSSSPPPPSPLASSSSSLSSYNNNSNNSNNRSASPPRSRELRLEFTAWFGKVTLTLGGHVLLTKKYSLLQSLRFNNDKFVLTIPSVPASSPAAAAAAAAGSARGGESDGSPSSPPPPPVSDLAGSRLSIVVTVGLDMELHGSAAVDGFKLPEPRTAHEKVAVVSSASSGTEKNGGGNREKKAAAAAATVASAAAARPSKKEAANAVASSVMAPASRSASQALSASSAEEGDGGAAAAEASAASSLASLEALSISTSEQQQKSDSAAAAAPLSSPSPSPFSTAASTPAMRLCAVPEDASAHAGREDSGIVVAGSTRGVAPREVGVAVAVDAGEPVSQSRPSPTSVVSAAGGGGGTAASIGATASVG